MKTLFGILLALIVPTAPTVASDIIFETNAQFELSQKTRGEAFTLFRAGDHAGALQKMEAALKERPGNTLLLGYVAFLAAETGDLKRAEEAATQYAQAGQTPGGGIQAKLAEKLPADVWQPIEAMFKENVSPKEAASKHATVPTEVKLVEGIAVSPHGETFVSSVVSGAIHKIDGDALTMLVDGTSQGMESFFGIQYDTLHNTIFATFARVAQTPGHVKGEGQTGLAEFDASTGVLKNKWVLDGTTDKHQIADLLITKDHTIYVSDATGRAVYKMDGAKLVKTFDVPGSMSPQGMAELDGRLYLADYGRGLWHLDTTTGAVSMVGRAAHNNLVGIDGLASYGDRLIAIQNGSNPHKVIAITISDGGMSVQNVEVLAQAQDGFDEPTLGTATASGYYFVAGSQWPKFGPGGTLKEGAELKSTAILKLD